MAKKQGKDKEVKSVTKTAASREYKELLESADKTVSKYRDIISRQTGKSQDEIRSEIEALYLDNLRKADDPVALMKENLVNLMLKKQTSDYVKEEISRKALEKAEEQGDEDKKAESEAEMIEELKIGDFDLKFHKAIMDGIKAVKDSEPRKVTNNTDQYDDNIPFENVIEVKNDK